MATLKIDAKNFNDVKQYDGNHFIIKNGKTTNPIKYNDNTYIVAKVEDVIPVVEIDKEKLLELNLTISKEIANDIQELFIKNLTSKQKIKINEALLDSLFQNNS